MDANKDIDFEWILVSQNSYLGRKPEYFMSKPVVAVPADIRAFDGTDWHSVQAQYINAVVKVADLMALIVPALEDGNDADAILDRVDGVMVTGSATNVHPSLYGREARPEDGPFDPARDATTLPLIRRAIERGIPILCICRGIQELNVALGGSLGSEIQEQPGIWDHRKPPSTSRDDMYSIRQPVFVKEGSCIARALGTGEIQVNSLHRQAISEIAPRLQVEAVAEDGTIEAVSVIDAKGYAVGVQWHPEYWAETDTPSRRLFEDFARAVRAHVAEKRN